MMMQVTSDGMDTQNIAANIKTNGTCNSLTNLFFKGKT